MKLANVPWEWDYPLGMRLANVPWEWECIQCALGISQVMKLANVPWE